MTFLKFICGNTHNVILAIVIMTIEACNFKIEIYINNEEMTFVIYCFYDVIITIHNNHYTIV